MPSAAITIKRIESNAVAECHALSLQAGWNQTALDWLRQYRLDPAGFFVALASAKIVGTVATCQLGSVGWISMMLVSTAYRRRGIGRSLMQHALRHMEGLPVNTIRLDATALGAPLYRSLGFKDEFKLVRYAGKPQPAGRRIASQVDSGVSVMPFDPTRASGPIVDSLCRIDRHAYGYDRRNLLTALLSEKQIDVWRADDESAYCLARPGREYRLIGPCVARENEQGVAIVESVIRNSTDQLHCIDVPSANQPACDLAESCSLRPHREFVRMRLGEPCREDEQLILASSGPEKG